MVKIVLVGITSLLLNFDEQQLDKSFIQKKAATKRRYEL